MNASIYACHITMATDVIIKLLVNNILILPAIDKITDLYLTLAAPGEGEIMILAGK